MRTIEAHDSQGIFKTIFEILGDGEPVRLQGSSSRAVVISEDVYETMAKAQRNAEYLAKIDRAIADVRAGKVITKTMAELEAMANE